MTKIIISFGIFTLILLGVLFGIKQNINEVHAPSEPVLNIGAQNNPNDPEPDTASENNQSDLGQTQNNIKTPTDEQLQAYTWVWQETQMNDGTKITPNQPDKFSLTFTKEGNLNGRTDCNGFGGSYKANQGVISFGSFMSTLMYCEGSQEQQFVKMVTDSTSYIFDSDDNLVLLIKYDSGSVLFKKTEKIN